MKKCLHPKASRGVLAPELERKLRKKTRVAIIVFAITASYGTIAFAGQKEATTPITKPLVAISGTDSHVKKPSYERVTTAKDWTRIWSRHLGTSTDDSYRPLFEVDFDRCFVAVIFLGERIQTRQIEIESVIDNADSVVIRFHKWSYGIALGPGDGPPPPEKPYAFIVLPKTDKVIVFEEKIWSKYEVAHNLPPKWKVRARLEPKQTASKQR